MRITVKTSLYFGTILICVSKIRLEELVSEGSAVGKKAKRDLNLVKLKMLNLLRAATDICNHCHEYDIIGKPNAK